jgi:integrase
MSSLRHALANYLAVRRSLGYKLARPEKLLAQFLTYLEDLGKEYLTVETAFAWASFPSGADRSWWSYRLSVVRCFAAYLFAFDPRTEVPPADLLASRPHRATPFLYSNSEIAALIVAAASLRTPHRIATYRTLIGLLAVTGVRVGEAIGLDVGDFDAKNGLLVIRNAKFGKSRELPLHPTARDALCKYLRRRDRPRSSTDVPAVFVSTAGTRLLYTNVQCTFHRLVRRVGLKPRSASCRPRLHDLRHTFAVQTVLDGYRESADSEGRLALLSTYLGHVDPARTYWYLSAAPELLQLAGERLERQVGGGS